MGIDLGQLLVGNDNTYYGSVNIKKNIKKDDDKCTITFLAMNAINTILESSGFMLNSMLNINYVNENTFFEYDMMKQSNYSANIFIPYGKGIYYSIESNGKFKFLTIDEASINSEPVFLMNHPTLPALEPFSEANKDFNGICEISCLFDFDFKKYLNTKPETAKYNVELIAILGHVHSKEDNSEIKIKDENEIIFKKEFGMDYSSLSEFIKTFRSEETKMRNPLNSNMDYSHMIFSKENEYYLFSQANSLGSHHDRFGIITKLVPDSSGISSSKISLVNYFECMNKLKKFQESVHSNKYSSEGFIQSVLSDLESSLK